MKKTKDFLIVAHRGASRLHPENTMDAFRAALSIDPGCMLEMDVWPTADGRVAVLHDGDLAMKTSGTGPVAAAPWGVVRNLDAGYNVSFDGGASFPFRGKGYHIPLFDEVLAAFPGNRLSVDIKCHEAAFADRVIGMIREQGAMERVVVGSFSSPLIRNVRRRHPDIVTACDPRSLVPYILLLRLGLACRYRPGGNLIMMPEFSDGSRPEFLGEGVSQGMRLLTPRLISDAGRKGIPVIIWTVDREENMRRLIGWGVDGIVTNSPDRLKRVVEEMG